MAAAAAAAAAGADDRLAVSRYGGGDSGGGGGGSNSNSSIGGAGSSRGGGSAGRVLTFTSRDVSRYQVGAPFENDAVVGTVAGVDRARHLVRVTVCGPDDQARTALQLCKAQAAMLRTVQASLRKTSRRRRVSMNGP